MGYQDWIAEHPRTSALGIGAAVAFAAAETLDYLNVIDLPWSNDGTTGGGNADEVYHQKLFDNTKAKLSDVDCAVAPGTDCVNIDAYKPFITTNTQALEQLLAKDPLVESMWGSYQSNLTALGVNTKASLYNKDFSALADLAKQIGFKDGIAAVHAPVYALALKNLNDTFANELPQWSSASIANIQQLQDLLAKDPVVDELWGAHEQEVKNEGYQTKRALYDVSLTDLAKLAYNIGEKTGSENAKQAIVAVHSTYLTNTKAALNDTFTGAEIDQMWGGPTLANITAMEHVLTLDPKLDKAFADPLQKAYLDAMQVSKKSLYAAQDPDTPVDNSSQYKWRTLEVRGIQAIDLNNMTGATRGEALDTLVGYHNDYNWSSEVKAFYKGPLDVPFEDKVRKNQNLSAEAKTALLNLAGLGSKNVEYVLVIDTPGNGAYAQAVLNDMKTNFLDPAYRTGYVIQDKDVPEIQKL